MSSPEILAVGGEQVPYFRTPEFSAVMLENERLMQQFVNAPDGSRTVFLTGSGTAAMEATVMGVLTPADKVLVIDGGSFGHRFVELCQLHEIPYTALHPAEGMPITPDDLKPYDGKGYTALLVNIHETSKGVLHDNALLGDFCRRNGMLFIVDAISSFLADPLDMSQCDADIVITGSQKVLACAPGISIIVAAPRALERIEAGKTKSMYLDLKSALKNGERGQTPFTPAVGILRQINTRLRQIESNGGVKSEIAKTHRQAEDFRAKIKSLPFAIPSQRMSNAMTPLTPLTASAYDIFTALKDRYGIWVCPNGGELRDKLFRVGHFGDQNAADNDTIIAALKDLQAKGEI
ncbi:MAG: aminotransferase class V-fold PLP-dependent enzyme [Bacteroides sp.]|nr:aminotransferase class V-fold PLP-dependent enzyme [Bacteroides sp.]MCM1446240.1 aminotransferase class V-fold PLP-dependent enzyme [Prevotella sp.]